MDFYIDPEKIAETVCSAPSKKQFGCQISEEVTLPDFCVDIARTIDCSADVALTGSVVEDGRLTVCGVAAFDLLYLSDKDPALHKYAFEKEFDASFDVGEGAEFLHAQVFAKDPTVRLSGARKFSVKLDCDLTALTVTENAVCRPEESDGVETKTESARALCAETVVAKGARVSEDIGLPGSMPPISEILYFSVRVGKTSVEKSESRLIVSADAELSVTYSCEGDGCRSYRCFLPLTQMAEYERADENAKMFGELTVSGIKYGAGIDSEGKCRIISVDFNVDAAVRIYRNTDVEYVADAYSTRGLTSPVTASVPVSRLVKAFSAEVEATADVEDSDGEIESILHVRSGARILQSRTDGGRFFARGVCDAVIFAKASVGGYGAYEQSIPFEYSCELADGAELMLSARAAKIEFEKTPSGASVTVTVGIEGEAFDTGVINCVTDLSVDENAPDRSDAASLVIYYPDADESLWDVAKAHGVSEKKLRDVNGLSDGSVTGKKFILIPRQLTK